MIVVHWVTYGIMVAALMLSLSHVRRPPFLISDALAAFQLFIGVVAIFAWLVTSIVIMWRVSAALWLRQKWLVLALVIPNFTLGATIAYFVFRLNSEPDRSTNGVKDRFH